MNDSEDLARVRRQIRVVCILDAADEAGISPVGTMELHAIAYFADALAPVWGLEVFETEVYKRRRGPLSPALQRDVDELVARGVVVANDVRHLMDGEEGWRLDAGYDLNRPFADRILAGVLQFPEQAAQREYLNEVVNAVSALGADGAAPASQTDAAYGDDLVAFGGLVDIAGSDYATNLSAQVALRFGRLTDREVRLSASEMVHLYVRQLHARLHSAA